jgi:hypothetical protein
VFDPLPGEGRWATVLLFDGNVGIGGDPVILLQRAARLLAPDGRVVVEIDSTRGPAHSTDARIERNGETTVWFPWALVTAESIDDIARGAHLVRTDAAWIDDRCFVFLARRTQR